MFNSLTDTQKLHYYPLVVNELKQALEIIRMLSAMHPVDPLSEMWVRLKQMDKVVNEATGTAAPALPMDHNNTQYQMQHGFNNEEVM